MNESKKLEGKPLAKFDTLSAAEEGMRDTGREVYWIAPDGRVYDSITFSDGACWLTIEATTIHALLELQQNMEMLTEGGWETSMLKVENDARIFSDSFRDALEAVKFKPLEQRKF